VQRTAGVLKAVKETAQITVTPFGDVTAFVDNFSLECG
jgi:hypothetical protein